MPAVSARADAGSGTRAPAPHQSMSCLPDVGAQDQQDSRADLVVKSSQLLPSCLERGEWPLDDDWGLSDHGVVTSCFIAQEQGPYDLLPRWLTDSE